MRLLILPVALLLLSVTTSGQELPAPAEPPAAETPAQAPAAVVIEAAPLETLPAASAWVDLDRALIGLDQAISQHNDPLLWTDVQLTLQRARDALAQAHAKGASRDLCLAAQRTLSVLERRQRELERRAFAESEEARSWNTEVLGGLVDDLLFAEGRLPETTYLLAETLFLLERDEEAQQALSRGLIQWPESSRLHETLRVWQDVLPRPADLIEQLNTRATVLGAANPAQAGMALETVGQLQMTLGRNEYQAGMSQGDPARFGLAGLLFDAAARSLLQSLSMPARMSPDGVSKMRGDALVNAAYSHLGRAKLIWKTDRIEEEQAPAAMYLAEAALTAALRLDRENQAYQDAVLYVGQEWMDKGHPDRVTNLDMEHARQFYGRLGAAFDNADWWNNKAFLSREMGTASYEEAEASELFEESYAAYERAIELAPENARFVNDTALILLHHLHRDEDRAEELFRRAWVLGKKVCDNPFVEQFTYDENFSAYTDAMLNLAHLKHEQGHLAEAREIAVQLVELDPERPDAALRLSMIERDLVGETASEGEGTPAG